MDARRKTEVQKDEIQEHAGEKPVSRLSKMRLWLAGYSALEVIAYRDNDHLLRDAGVSREEAQDHLRAWRIVGLLLLPRRGRE